MRQGMASKVDDVAGMVRGRMGRRELDEGRVEVGTRREDTGRSWVEESDDYVALIDAS